MSISLANKPDEYHSLCDFSAQIGSDPWQIQGAGGNTSVKSQGVMWIKASGTWLMKACEQELFVPVELKPLLSALNTGDARAEKSLDFVIDELNPSALRPSIETTVHAVLPQSIVIHIHCVDTIAIAIRKDAETLLGKCLKEFNWKLIPYKRPGLPLSRGIAERIDPDTNVLVLGNHGLVVAADSVDAARKLLVRVRAAIKQPVRSATTVNTSALLRRTEGSRYSIAQQPESHAIAFDKTGLSVACRGSLYPDHVIFLGEGTELAQPGESCLDVQARLLSENKNTPVSIVFADEGVVLDEQANAGQHALARCLSDVCLRVPEDAPINYLQTQQTYELLNWEAEQYRQTLNV